MESLKDRIQKPCDTKAVSQELLQNVYSNTLVQVSQAGAGSLVTKDVHENTVIAGNPAKAIKTIEEYNKKLFKTCEEQKPSRYFVGIRDGVKYDLNIFIKSKIEIIPY